ncbi:PucR family transcriptional regulator [Bacillus pseudomycoides]|uniref:PucR family transcriptional regulator n=1 Tax=Bacillus pseudomycoides TaxID=64104 RepID=UPI000BEF8928|nr:helix-turn-helix domain-containing protein [Bacillus pseudomycoides]PEK30473.1 PucR family transcriptional regulator [Bacillus pseudomycoides]PEK68168.1 PucR family transcriptional regulator [Bacillus pseudomycoides]PEP44333.1 PucR family transcriptional regulator [Bacillus pseudomycoides]PEP46758.1 PucR family transcriptional regulator [Bacillus pseudomycoides]PFX51176.1 PucR family transcriptional regulator [Bacillus pseudomycoides]
MKNNSLKVTFDNLEEFADIISEILQCPITVEDVNHRLLAYSTHDERTDSARIATIMGRRVPEKVINNLWKEGVIPTLLKSREPIHVKKIDNIGLGDRVAISIWNKEDVLGFIWALEIKRSLTEQDYALMKKSAEAVKSKLLQLQTRKNKKDERSQEFFWKLLTNHIQTNEEIIEDFQVLHITPASLFNVVVFHFEQEITSEKEKQISYLLKTSEHLKILLYTIDRNKLILLTSLDNLSQPSHEINNFVERFVNTMEKRYEIKSIKPAFSSVYSDYQKISKAYKETLIVLSIKEKFPSDTANIHGYQNMGIYQLIDLLLEQRKQEEYENQALQKLHKYDCKYNSNLVETLEIFLNNDSNTSEVAKVLNIHVNTLSYRLKRICEISEIDLKDPNQKMVLYLDLKLQKFM